MRGMRIVILLALALGTLAGCGGEPQDDPDANKLVVIGIDSADWGLLRPMLDEGRLPHLRRFMDQSAHGRMKTFYPLEKSPVLWASITTGVRPEVHGINTFVRGENQEPVVGSAWYAPALWDILGAADKSTAIIGMWNTYPSRPIDGVMVSDYLPYGQKSGQAMTGLVTPDSLAERILACRVLPGDLTAETLSRFVDTDDMPALETRYPDAMMKLRSVLAADMSYLAVARLLAAERDFDLFFFYQRGPDMISHYFYHLLMPERSTVKIAPEEQAAFGQVVRRYYDWSDEVMAEVLSWFPPSRQAVVLSDHGFHGPRLDGGKGTAEHSEWGIFLVRSGLYERNRAFGHLELLDICPTLLTLMGLPPAVDMPGAVLSEGLTDAGRVRVESIERNRVPSYVALRPAQGPAAERDEAVDEEIRKQLRSLGYIK